MKFSFTNSSKGITLVEIIVVIFIITIFSTILITDFPKIQRQFALSRSAYKLAQDLRRMQGLGLSGALIKDKNGADILGITGYGIYVNTNLPATKYLMYANIGPGDTVFGGTFNTYLCSDTVSPTNDCIMEIVDISKEAPGLFISNITGIGSYEDTSINFSPPNPIINIDKSFSSEIGIVLSNNLSNRTVKINTSGLISVE